MISQPLNHLQIDLPLPLTLDPRFFSQQSLTCLVSKTLGAGGWESRPGREHVPTESSRLSTSPTLTKRKHTHRPPYRFCPLCLPLPELQTFFRVLTPRRSFSPLSVLMGARVFTGRPRMRRNSSDNLAVGMQRAGNKTVIAQLCFVKEEPPGVGCRSQHRGETDRVCCHARSQNRPRTLTNE